MLNQELTKPFLNIMKKFQYKKSNWEVFTDFLAVAAISISNLIDIKHYDERNKQLNEIMTRYSREEQCLFQDMFDTLISSMQICAENKEPADLLGQIFHELELHNEYHGQFFTPQHVSDLMAGLTLHDFGDAINQKGYITVYEPTCGSGVMVISAAKLFAQSGYNYSTQFVANLTDIDLKCVHMAYIQLSMYGIPAVIQHGNTLLVQTWSEWYTPLFILNRHKFKEIKVNATIA